MKNVISTLTILLLIFGIGLVIPKMIPSRAVAGTHLQQDNLNPEGTEPDSVTLSAESDPSDAQSESHENSDNPSVEDENTTHTEENFPIKTAETDTSFPDKRDENHTGQTSSVDKMQPVVDIPKKDQPSQPTKDAVSSNDTNETQEVPVSKPQAPEITFKAVSYTRWVTTPLNMRKGPGKETELISSIPMAQSVLVTSMASNGWAKVTYAGKEGFVSGKYLSETEVKKPAPAPAPAPTPSAPAPAPSPSSPAPEVQQPVAPKPQTPSYEAYKMYVGGKTITYKNGGIANGQSIIDSNSKLISTWGGAETFSGNDGYNTHFIGHNPGVFSVLTQLGNGSTIIVTDSNGVPTTYKVTRIFTVDDNAHNAADGENYYNYMVSKRGGEVITLQTCLSSNKNLIIRAEKIN